MDAPFQKRHLSAKVEMSTQPHSEGAPEMKITTIGADLAKSVIQIHGVDSHGLPQRGRRQRLRHALVHRVAHQLAGEHVLDAGQVKPALAGGDIGVSVTRASFGRGGAKV